MILYETKFLTLKAAKRENKPDWVYVTRPNAKGVIVILPVLKKEKEDEILFLITKRPPLEGHLSIKYSIELPAGLIGDENPDETIEEALKKELLEETGHKAWNFKIIPYKISSSGGLTDEISTIAIATITDFELKSIPVDDGGVIVERIYVKKSEIRNFLNEKAENGYAISAQALSALFFME